LNTSPSLSSTRKSTEEKERFQNGHFCLIWIVLDFHINICNRNPRRRVINQQKGGMFSSTVYLQSVIRVLYPL
jgi:hypothetical protein